MKTSSSLHSRWFKLLFHPATAGCLLLLLIATTGTPAQNCCPEVNGAKWIQPPDVFSGFDINASQGFTLADDFGCTIPGPITDIRIWGSWLSDVVDANATFTLTIWSDVPFAAGNPFSHPGIPLWSQPFGPGHYTMCPYTNYLEGFFAPTPTGLINSGYSTNLYYLCFKPDPAGAFPQTGTPGSPTNYWLSVYVQTSPAALFEFGWKTSTTNYNDTAVWGNGIAPASWTPMTRPIGAGGPVNMAFKINTTPTCSQNDNPKYTQGPNLIGGVDVWDSSTRPPQAPPTEGPFWLADDFPCTNTGPITDIHLWGSWQNDSPSPNSITFQLYVLDDVPPDSVFPYSHPGTNIIWHQTFPPGSYAETIWTPNASEYFLDPGPPQIDGGDNVVWYYCFNPTNLMQTGTAARKTNYWLAAFAELPSFVTNVFGWKSTTNFQNDISVHAPWPGFGVPPIGLPWQPTFEYPGNQNPLDLAFMITSPNCTVPITCPNDKRVECGTSWSFDPPIVGTDPCCATQPGMSVIVVTNSTLQCNQSYTATWTITNCLGTVLKVCSQTVTVTDTTPPVMYCTNLVLGCNDMSYTNPPFVFDRCCGNNVTVKLESSQLVNNSCGQTILQTWLATDCCSNSIECIRRVNIVAGLGNALVVPTNNATVEGDGGNSYPFNIGASNMRYQQVYDASQFGAVPTDGAMITAISFRVDAGFPAFSGTLPGIQINLSTTFKAPGGLDPTFANNVGADDTVVFSGPLNLSSAASGSPAAFDIIIPLTTPFFYDPYALLGNLLLDVRNTGGGSISQFDATSTNTSVSRLYGGVGSATGVADSTGLVTDFTFGTGILTVICTNVILPYCNPVPLIPPVVADACCTNWTVVNAGTQIIGLHPCIPSYWQFWHVFDCCSNHITCTTVITMEDTNPPVFLNCVSNKTVPCSSAWSFDTPAAQYFCTGSNAVVGVISTVTNVGNGCSQTATRIWGATNECTGALATCTEVVTIIDTNPPVLVGCVASKQVQCGTAWTFDTPTAHYFCSGSNVPVGVVSTSTNIATPCSNVVTRVWGATNACDGLVANCSENIIITDTNPPSITCPTNIIVYTCVTNPVVVTWSTNVASDTCSSVTVTSSPPSGTAFQPNTTNVVTLTARDACGNTNSCTFMVELRRPVLGGLTVTYSPPNITLHWTDGILSQADSLSGPWTDTLGASPPSYTVSASAAARFYRLRCSSP